MVIAAQIRGIVIILPLIAVLKAHRFIWFAKFRIKWFVSSLQKVGRWFELDPFPRVSYNDAT